MPTLPATVVAAPVEVSVSTAEPFQSKLRLAPTARDNAAVEVPRAVPSARLKVPPAPTASVPVAGRLLAPLQSNVPPLTFVPPVWVLAPERVSVPPPVLVRASSRVEPFWSTPAKVLAVPLLTVRVSVPAVPEPLSRMGVPTVAFVFKPTTVMLLPLS